VKPNLKPYDDNKKNNNSRFDEALSVLHKCGEMS
jgi:hypothetical protein